MASLGRLVVTMSANIAEFTGAMDKAAFIADQRSRAIGRAIDNTLKVVGRTAATVGVVLGNEIRKSLNIAEDIKNFSQSVGLGVEEFQRLGFAAQQNGVSVEELRSSLAKFANAVTDNSDALRAMGIATRDAAGNVRPLGEVFAEVAERFARYRDGAQKTALAQDIFGRSGSTLIPVLNEGAEGLKRLGDEAERAGLVMSSEAVAAAADLSNRIDALKGSLRGVVNQIMTGMIPALDDVARGLGYAAGQTQLWQQIGEGLGAFIRQVVAGLTALAGAAVAAGQGLFALGKAAVEAFKGNFGEAWLALSEGKEEALLSLTQGLDKAAVILGVGTASVIAQRQRLEEEARRAARLNEDLLNPPEVGAVKKGDKSEEDRLKRIASLVNQVEQSYRDLSFTKEEQILQDLRSLGATDELIAQMENMIFETERLRMAKEEQIRVAREDERIMQEQKALYESFPQLYYDSASAAERYRIDLERLEEQKQKLIVSGVALAEVEQWAANRAKQLGDAYKNEVSPAVMDFAHAIGTAFEDAIVNGQKLSDVLKGLLQDILRIIVRVTITTPLQNYLTQALSAGGSGLFGALGSLLGIGTNAPNTPAPSGVNNLGISGAFATGGIVRRGSTYLVGERGPELFTAFGDGRIVSNATLDALAGRSQSPPPVRQVFNITTPNADSFRLSQRQLTRRMRLALAV